MKKFKDVDKSRWSYEDIQWASSMGILSGFNDGTFRPTDFITREQFAAILRRVVTFTWGKVVEIAEKSTVYLERGYSHGTGVFIKGNYVLTAKHVVGESDYLQVETKEGKRYTAQVIARHNTADITILRVQTFDELSCLMLTRNANVRSCEEVLTIGHPKNEKWKATSGKVQREQVGGQPWEFEIECEVDSGNSGGAVLNQQCEIIGIMVQRSGSDTAEVINLTNKEIRQWVEKHT